MVMLQKRSLYWRENGESEVVSWRENGPCYRGGQFNGGRIVMLQKGGLFVNGGGMVMLQRWSV